MTTLCIAGNAEGDIFVGRPPVRTSTILRLSRAKITYGHEQAERLTVTVRSSRGAPSGTMLVTEGAKTICKRRLKGGMGSCILGAKRLKLGSHKLRARFVGSNGFLPSTSAAEKLRVIR